MLTSTENDEIDKSAHRRPASTLLTALGFTQWVNDQISLLMVINEGEDGTQNTSRRVCRRLPHAQLLPRLGSRRR
jgi:hypothetical protein